MDQMPALIRVFAYLSLLTVGGGMAAFPELKILTVDVHHWLTFQQLVHLYSIGQMAPGPNMMMIVSIGEWVAGLPGAVVVFVAFFFPTTILALAVGRVWLRLEGWPWREAIKRGLAPVSLGLLLAGCITLSEVALTGVVPAVIAVVVLGALLRTTINPALLILAGALVGLVALRGG